MGDRSSAAKGLRRADTPLGEVKEETGEEEEEESSAAERFLLMTMVADGHGQVVNGDVRMSGYVLVRIDVRLWG